MDASSAAQATADLSTLVKAYRPLPGVFDEMVDSAGRLRPHWLPFLGMLAGLGPEETGRRFATADRHLRDSGVFYRVYEDPAGVRRGRAVPSVPAPLDVGGGGR